MCDIYENTMNKKLLIIVIAVVVVGLGGYLYFTNTPDTADTTDTVPGSSTLVSTNTGENPVPIAGDTDTTTTADGTDIAALLSNISSIRLDTTILGHPAFLALTDTTMTLPQVQVNGRINPFGSSGATVAPVSTNTTPASSSPTMSAQ